MGGLGNQMFQYALGRALSHIHKRPLFLDLSAYGSQKFKSSWAFRDLGLNHFNLKITEASQEDIAGFQKYTQPTLLSRLLRRVFNFRSFGDRSYIKEPLGKNFVFDSSMLTESLEPVVYIDGYWQSPKYFTGIEDIIREEFRFKEPPHASYEDIISVIQAANSVALHIRHGDNATAQRKIHGVLPFEYYYKSLADLEKKVLNPRVFVFSDDIEYTKSNFKASLPVTFVVPGLHSRDYEDLRLMTLCKHHIIGNSTFSWWGAYLGKKNGQLVYAPSRYHIGKQKEEVLTDYYPPDWKIVNI